MCCIFKRSFNLADIIVDCGGSEHVEGRGSELNSVTGYQIWRNQVNILDCDRAVENPEHKFGKAIWKRL